MTLRCISPKKSLTIFGSRHKGDPLLSDTELVFKGNQEKLEDENFNCCYDSQ